jgi:hypothetical protein
MSKRQVFSIASRTWTVQKSAERDLICLRDGTGVQIFTRPQDTYLANDNTLIMTSTALRDEDNAELKKLLDWIHAEQWPRSSPMNHIKKQLEPNHAP